MKLMTDTKELTITNFSEMGGAVLSLRSTSCAHQIVENEICIQLSQRNSMVVVAALLESAFNGVSAESILKELHKLQDNKLF